MSTRSCIVLCEPGSTIDSGKGKGITCHFDGYPEGVGVTLMIHYRNPKNVNDLIELGRISQLRAHAKPWDEKQEHSFTSNDGITTAYHRDRGDPYYPPVDMKWDDKHELKNYSITQVDYLYLGVPVKDHIEWKCYLVEDLTEQIIRRNSTLS